ncbi:iron chelate uptake ABC transporter family permease subunit [Methyloligella sp. 2.7D]|uniref:iron chelate uptake ABC transporter family permease subunit n=1 Tax=unclassified Methyloligella TaxID=2625955 RepID=UPI00157CFE40|nr:iron chelate uptake ABC transporter family permease subunit [Methyloligella sp. GL2]QKP78851.1 iron chelate uptake ABC transporter family permease subunit [Methyloligella sp. GL2]
MVLALGGLATVSAIAFMTIGAKGNWDFVLPFRGVKLAGMVLVGYAIAVSTVLFQTVTQNRILTPSVMGFDALYILIQTCLVYFVGAAGFASIDPRLLFGLEVAVMVTFAVLLFRWLFSGRVRSIYLLMLVGLVFGILFRSLAGFLQRIIDPNDFVALQGEIFASFNAIDQQLLLVAAIAVLLVSLIGWRLLHTFDVLALGRETAINLGVDYRRTVTLILILISILVSVSTALVGSTAFRGPAMFFGLLVSNLAYQLVPTHRHVYLLPAAAFIAIICLAGGQTLLEQVVDFGTALPIVIEFLGGLVFILLLLKGAAR